MKTKKKKIQLRHSMVYLAPTVYDDLASVAVEDTLV